MDVICKSVKLTALHPMNWVLVKNTVILFSSSCSVSERCLSYIIRLKTFQYQHSGDKLVYCKLAKSSIFPPLLHSYCPAQCSSVRGVVAALGGRLTRFFSSPDFGDTFFARMICASCLQNVCGVSWLRIVTCPVIVTSQTH